MWCKGGKNLGTPRGKSAPSSEGLGSARGIRNPGSFFTSKPWYLQVLIEDFKNGAQSPSLFFRNIKVLELSLDRGRGQVLHIAAALPGHLGNVLPQDTPLISAGKTCQNTSLSTNKI